MRASSQVLIPAGSLRHQVQIQQQTPGARTPAGSPLATWCTIRTTMARIVSIKQIEDYQQGQFSGQATHTITVRWSPTPEILGGMRVIYTPGSGPSHTYLVQIVDNVNLRNIRIDLMCLEINGAQ
jgi:head-tail adaptor